MKHENKSFIKSWNSKSLLSLNHRKCVVFWINMYLLTCSLATARSPPRFASGSREFLSFLQLANPRSHANFQFFCSKSRFWKMNWGFQKLGVSELTPDRPALNFEFVRCEKSWLCVGKPPNPRSHANFLFFAVNRVFEKWIESFRSWEYQNWHRIDLL